MFCHPKGCPPQNDHPNPMPQMEGIQLVSLAKELNQQPPVLTVMNLSGPINAVPSQIDPHGGKHRINIYLSITYLNLQMVI